jgi:hypothetical protein
MHKRDYRDNCMKGRLPTTKATERAVALRRPAATPPNVHSSFTNSTDRSSRKTPPDDSSGIRVLAGAPRRLPITEIFLGTVNAARMEARRIINEPKAGRYTRIIEGWQQCADGRIQFTIRTLSEHEGLRT